MARPLRIEYEGALYHITSRGNEKRKIFLNDNDRNRFLECIDKAYKRYGIVLYAVTLMDNHYHLLMETPQANLNRVMHDINCSYTIYFNKKHKRVGHLLQGRYKGILIQKENYLLELSRYIHLNAVRAGIVDMPEDYSWSSMKYNLGLAKKPAWLNTDFVLQQFGSNRKNAIKDYRRFVMEGLGEENPLKNSYAQCILGSKRFIEQVKGEFLCQEDIGEEIIGSNFLKSDLTLEKLKNAILTEAELKGEVPFDKKIKRDNIGLKMFVFLARRHTGKKLREIAEFLDFRNVTAITKIYGRFAYEIQENRLLKEKVLAFEKKLKVMSDLKT